MTRRELLKLIRALPVLWLARPRLTFSRETLLTPRTREAPYRNRVLVLLELHGGNDGLNTVIPYTDSQYYEFRPSLAIPRDQVLHLTPSLGFHPSLQSLMPLWESGELAVIQGVGYADPNRSHFRSIEIWDTGSDANQVLEEGWLARVFHDHPPPATFTADAVVLDKGNTGPVSGESVRTLTLQDPAQFIQQSQRVQSLTMTTSNPALAYILKIQQEISNSARDLHNRLQQIDSPSEPFPQTQIGHQLEIAAKLLMAQVPVGAIKVMHGSFDTHASQANTHHRLLKELAEAVQAFRTTLRHHSLWDKVLIMTYSEFGRRVRENGSKGTDHGTAAPHLLIGGRIKGGLYGRPPSLRDLQNGDLRFTTDYRSLYNTVIHNWWNFSTREFPRADAAPINCIV